MRILFIMLTVLNLCESFGQSNSSKLIITRLKKNFYVYTTFGDPGNGSKFPANGMYVVTRGGVILFDTPWDSTQLQPLLDSILERHQLMVVMCIATHFHNDRTAGLEYYRQRGIKTFTTKRTDDISIKRNQPRAEYLIYNDTVIRTGDYSFETFYPGKGHSPDNIVIWFNNDKVLYGGCFVKSVETENLGNLTDASIDDWINSIKKVRRRYPKAESIVTGHQSWTSKNSLKHTLDLLIKYKTKKIR